METLELKDLDRKMAPLIESISKGRASHAYILAGPGSGMEIALEMAKAANCRSGASRPCGRCSTCRRIETGNHPDVMVISPSGATIKIGAMRELRADAEVKPFERGKKVYIIDEAHRMTAEAANSILKLLEEPPHFCMFILITTALQRLLPTLVSRCQVVEFNLPAAPLEEETSELYRRTEEIIELMNSFAGGRADAVVAGETLLGGGRESLAGYLDVTASLVRDMLIYGMTGDERFIINKGAVHHITRYAANIPAKRLLALLEAVTAFKLDLEKNANTSLLVTALLLELRGVFSGDVHSSGYQV